MHRGIGRIAGAHRSSPDPGLREAYGDVHELISDLAALHAVIQELRPAPDGHDVGPPVGSQVRAAS